MLSCVHSEIFNLPCLWSRISITFMRPETVTVALCTFGIVLFRCCASIQSRKVTRVREYSSTVCKSCSIRRTKCSVLILRFFCVLHYLLLSVDVVLRVSLELCPLDIYFSTIPGWMQCDCGSWIRWPVGRIRSCADNLGGGRERDIVQRAAKRYDNDSDGKYVGLRLPLLAAVMMRRERFRHRRADVE